MLLPSSPQVSLIIVTFNAEDFIVDCLNSIEAQSFQDFETIVVDNGSNDTTVEIITSNFAWVKLIQSPDNLGFTGGVSLAYTYAQGQYIALLNPDTRADRFWLENLVNNMEQNDQLGICASLMLQWNSQVIDTAGDGCTWSGKGFKLGSNQPAELYNQDREVFAACGGAVLYRRKMLEEIGFFDPDFFLLHEDTDLSYRAQLAGWQCQYVSKALVEHKVSATIGYKSSLAVYHSVKNSDMVWLKNTPFFLLFLSLPEKIISDIASFIYLGIIHGRLKEFFQAKLYILKNISRIMSKRKMIQANIKITNNELIKMLTPFLSFKHQRTLWQNKKQEIKLVRQPGSGPK